MLSCMIDNYEIHDEFEFQTLLEVYTHAQNYRFFR